MLTKEDIDYLENFSKINSTDPRELFKQSGLDPESDFVGVDFSSVMMQGIDLSNFNLRGANFSKSILLDANFSGANLIGANFSNTNLMGANFTDALTDKSTNLSSAYIAGVIGLDNVTANDEVEPVGSILLIEDEPTSILAPIKELYDTFPFIDIDIVESQKDGVEMLRSKEYLFTIIDAKIPATSEIQANDLIGQKISEQLSSGDIESLNSKMKHAILTEHKSVLKTMGGLVGNDKLVAIIEKSDKTSTFKEKVIYNIYNGYLECFATVTSASGGVGSS